MNNNYLDKNGNPLRGGARLMRGIKLKECYNHVRNEVNSYPYPNNNARMLFTIIPQPLFTVTT